jgi:hypothetical protein
MSSFKLASVYDFMAIDADYPIAPLTNLCRFLLSMTGMAFLAEAGLGRKIVQLEPTRAFFSQGGPLTLSLSSERSRKTH